MEKIMFLVKFGILEQVGMLHLVAIIIVIVIPLFLPRHLLFSRRSVPGPTWYTKTSVWDAALEPPRRGRWSLSGLMYPEFKLGRQADHCMKGARSTTRELGKEWPRIIWFNTNWWSMGGSRSQTSIWKWKGIRTQPWLAKLQKLSWLVGEGGRKQFSTP